MIRLSDVKVRLQYRWTVRQRLMVIHYARLHGPTAAARRFGYASGRFGAGERGGVPVGLRAWSPGIRGDADAASVLA